MLSRFSHVWLSATPWTVAHQVLWPQDSPGKNTGVGCHALLQGIFPTQESNTYLRLLHCRQILYGWTTGEALNQVYSNIKLKVFLKKQHANIILSYKLHKIPFNAHLVNSHPPQLKAGWWHKQSHIELAIPSVCPSLYPLTMHYNFSRWK